MQFVFESRPSEPSFLGSHHLAHKSSGSLHRGADRVFDRRATHVTPEDRQTIVVEAICSYGGVTSHPLATHSSVGWQ
ncbi:MAG: hypothetical protein ACI9OJ_000952 [Myxococcota bacterium]|jgi:hypothetical protein